MWAHFIKSLLILVYLIPISLPHVDEAKVAKEALARADYTPSQFSLKQKQNICRKFLTIIKEDRSQLRFFNVPTCFHCTKNYSLAYLGYHIKICQKNPDRLPTKQCHHCSTDYSHIYWPVHITICPKNPDRLPAKQCHHCLNGFSQIKLSVH